VAQVAQDRDALNLVVGATVPVADLPGARVPAHPVVAGLPANVPSSVLDNRPDILAAEYTLRADYADIGAARAAFFPRISLTSSIGFATQELSGLFKGSNRTWSVSPQINLPIFDAGTHRAALNITKIQRKIDVANYQNAVQTAFSEVADTLATRATIYEQIAAQQALVAANRRAYQLSQARYRYGTDSYLDTLVDQRTLYASRKNEVSRRLARQTNLVTLYKVLGGGGLAAGENPSIRPGVRLPNDSTPD
jgi:multidrug efflux system outer membrane protein